MRLLKRDIDRFGFGSVKVQADESEDMWHLYNLITAGDAVSASTVRKVVKEISSGATAANKIKIYIKICVEKIEFDQEQCSLRVSGKNIEENEHVRVRLSEQHYYISALRIRNRWGNIIQLMSRQVDLL